MENLGIILVEKPYRISTLTRTAVFQNTAKYFDSVGANGLYYIHNNIALLRGELGDKLLIDYYKDRYDFVIRRLSLIGMILKNYQYCYEEARYNPQIFAEARKNVPLVQDLLFEVYAILIMNTNLKDAHIPAEYFMRQRKYIAIKYMKELEKEREKWKLEREGTQSSQSERETSKYY